jgi:hypothetical protein
MRFVAPPSGRDGSGTVRLTFKQIRAAAKIISEEAAQIALEYRDEVEAGKHPGFGDPERAMGMAFAANYLAKRIRRRLTADRLNQQ